MKHLTLHFDLRAPEYEPPVEVTPIEDLYTAALEMCVWAEEQGFHHIGLSCHHGSDDNYCSSMTTFAAAVVGRTSRIHLTVPVTLPLYDPLHVAEDFAVLDIMSRGRVTLLGVGGYVPEEYAMFGVSPRERGKRMDEAVTAIKKAWTGDPFEFRGEPVTVRPRPVSRPGPRFFLGGDSPAAARRAAREADGYLSVHGSPSWDDYVAACRELGKEPTTLPGQDLHEAMYLQVARDPDDMAKRVEPYLLHVANSYSKWLSEAGLTDCYTAAASVEELRASGNFEILTPEQCLEYVADAGTVMLDPLFGGIPPEIGWESLDLFAREVLAHLDVAAREVRAT